MNVNHARSMKFAGRRRRLEYISWGERTPALGRATRRPATWALVKADGTLLASWVSVLLLMVYDRRSALSRALYAGTQVLFCPPTTLSS